MSEPSAVPGAAAPPSAFGRRAGLIFFGRFVLGLGQLLTIAALVHLLDKRSFGALSHLLLLYATATGIVVMATPDNVLFFFPRLDPGQRRATAWQLVRILGALGALAGAVLLVLGLFPGTVFGDAPWAARYVPLLAVYAMLDLPAWMLPNLLIVEDRHRWASLVSIGQSAAQVLAILVPCALGLPLWAPLVALIGYGVLNFGALLIVVRRLYRAHTPTPGAVTVRRHVAYALPLGLSVIVGTVIRQFDKFVVLYVIGLTAFAEYTVGAWEIPLVTLLPYSIGAAAVPLMVKSFRADRPREALALWKGTIPKVALIVLPVVVLFLICADDFIDLIFGSEYLRAAGPLRLFTLILLQRVAEYGAILRAGGLTRPIFISSLIALAGNLVLSVPLAYLIGFNGPALAALLATIPCFLYVIRRIGLATGTSFREAFPWAAYGRVLGVALLAAGPAAAVKWGAGLSASLNVAVVGAGYLICFALLGTLTRTIRREDWSFVRRWLSLRDLIR